MATENTHSAHDLEHGTCGGSENDLRLNAGVVICNGCNRPLPDHPDSNPQPGLVEANQWR